MKVLLTYDVDGMKAGEIHDLRDGYAEALVNQGLAAYATDKELFTADPAKTIRLSEGFSHHAKAESPPDPATQPQTPSPGSRRNPAEQAGPQMSIETGTETMSFVMEEDNPEDDDE